MVVERCPILTKSEQGLHSETLNSHWIESEHIRIARELFHDVCYSSGLDRWWQNNWMMIVRFFYMLKINQIIIDA